MAPAMNTQMWAAPAVARNVAQLKADGVTIIEPGEGWLSCRTKGTGRMAEPEAIRAAIEKALKIPGHAIAVVPLRPLLSQGGVLDRLRADGFDVKTPGEDE